MKNKFGAFGARQFSLETLVGGRPGTTIFQNPGGEGGGGGAGGGRIQGPGPATPPCKKHNVGSLYIGNPCFREHDMAESEHSHEPLPHLLTINKA